MLKRLLTFDALNFPLWTLLAGLAFIWLVDWAAGGQLSHSSFAAINF